MYFISDTELISLKDKIKLKTIELSNHVEEYLLLAGNEAAQINIVNTLPNVIPDNSYKTGKLEHYYKKRNGINKDYQEKKLEKFKILSPLNLQLDLLISNRVHDFEHQ